LSHHPHHLGLVKAPSAAPDVRPATDPFSNQPPEALLHFHRVLSRSLGLRDRHGVLDWLKGDMQHYLPHDIMVCAWGDFSTGEIEHDVISVMNDVPHQSPTTWTIDPMLARFFNRWHQIGRKAYALNAGERGFLLEKSGVYCALSEAMKGMRSAMVHGIMDARGVYNSLYVTFRSGAPYDAHRCEIFNLVLPCLDHALRQVGHAAPQAQAPRLYSEVVDPKFMRENALTDREVEIVEWVAMGKTNSEIGSILGLSLFTVKNHLQRIFKKMNVSNRAQAVAKLTSDV
jgi:transcriptional regulator EpsA